MELTSKMKSVAMQAKSVDELLEMAKKYGHSVSREEAEKIYAELNQECELANEELEDVVGGCRGCVNYDGKCLNCGSEDLELKLTHSMNNSHGTGDDVVYYLYQCRNCGRQRKKYADGSWGKDEEV